MDFEDSHDASRDRRDRLLAALLDADPGLILLECSDGIAHLLGTKEPARILLVTASNWAHRGALRGALKHLATNVPADSVATQLVVVGGGDEVEPTIKHA